MPFTFFDSEDAINNPYTYIRCGVINKVIDDFKDIKNYFTLVIDWLDRGGVSGDEKSKTSLVKLTYPHISRGWGLQYKPSIGDIVICGFRLGGYAVLLGFQSVKFGDKVLHVDDSNVNPGYFFRDVVEGEYCWKSQKGAEWYLDRKGSLRLIVRDQTTNHKIDDDTRNIHDEIPTDTPSVEVTVGQVYDNTFTIEQKSLAGNSLRLQIEDKQNNTKITLDNSGNVDILTNGIINIGNNAQKGVARKDDSVKSTSSEDVAFWTWLDGFVKIFQNWTPVIGDGGSSLKIALSVYLALNPAPTTLTSKIITSSNTVKAKD